MPERLRQSRKTIEQERQELAVEFASASRELSRLTTAARDAKTSEENAKIELERLACKFASHVGANRSEVIYKTAPLEVVVVRMKYPKPATGRLYDVKVRRIEPSE